MVKTAQSLSEVSFAIDSSDPQTIMAGCDAIMIDPLTNPPQEFAEFKLAAEVMTAKDEYAISYLKYVRAQKKSLAFLKLRPSFSAYQTETPNLRFRADHVHIALNTGRNRLYSPE